MKTNNAEIIGIGSELLRGKINERNCMYLARGLTELGFTVNWVTMVGDDLERMVELLTMAAERSDLIITTGGLGPTLDDITRPALVQALGCELRQEPEVVKMIEERFRKFNREVTDNNLLQAQVPVRGGYFYNANGTAPGLYFEETKTTAIALPGPPHEMNPMFMKLARPYLTDRFSMTTHTLSRSLHCAGTGESYVDEIIRGLAIDEALTYSILARPGLIDITLSRMVPLTKLEDELLNQEIDRIANALGSYIFGRDDEQTMSVVIGRLLRKSKATVAVAESCTGGGIGAELTSVPGCSDYFLGGILAYDNKIKATQLKVPGVILETEGAVSSECCEAMANGVRNEFDSDYGISVTGIAGPGGGTAEKPIGLVYVAIAGPHGTRVVKCNFAGSRTSIRQRTVTAALYELFIELRSGDKNY